MSQSAKEAPPGRGAPVEIIASDSDYTNTLAALPKQIKSYKRRATRRYATMLRLHDHGIQADVIPLARRPDPDRVVSQILGIDLIVDPADAEEDSAWLRDRDVLFVKGKSPQLCDDFDDTLIVIPLKIAAEIVLAAQDISEQLVSATALNISAGLVRPERRRKSQARRGVL